MTEPLKVVCIIPLYPPFSGYWDYKERVEVPFPPDKYLVMKSGHVEGDKWLTIKRYELHTERRGDMLIYRYIEVPGDSAAPDSEQSPLVTQSTLGINGRFGNQIFQYAFQRILAAQRGMGIQTPDWIGQELFGHRDPPMTALGLPICAEGRDFPEAEFPEGLFAGAGTRFDLYGFFQFHTKYYAPHRDFFRSLFRPVPAVEEPLKCALLRLRRPGRTLVGIHARRGDFNELNGMFFIAPSEWYLQFLREIWPTLNDPLLYIASDEPDKVVADFAEFNPVTTADLGVPMPQAAFYPDFYLLTQCDVLGISNSTYSFAAAMLNEKAAVFRRPDLYEKKLVPFDPWNSLPLLHRELATPLTELMAGMQRQSRGEV
jgi:hypothetical protein